MKKLIVTALAAITILFMSITAFASEIADKEVLKVGYVKGYGGIRDIDAVIEKGYLCDMFKRMEDFCDYSFEFVEYQSFNDIVEAVNNGEVQYFGPIMKTQENIKQFVMPFTLTNGVVSLVANENVQPLYYDDPQSIDGKTVASYEDSTLESYLDEYCATHNISVKYVRSNLKDYHELEADYYLVSSVDYQFFNYQTAINFTTLPLCVATTEENKTEYADVTRAFYTMLSCDVDFLYELHEKYYEDSSAQRRSLTKEEVDKLQNHTFKVAFESGHDFFSYFNEDGEPDGLLIQLLNEVLAGVGAKEVEYISYQMGGEGENSVEYVVDNADIVISSKGKYKDFKDDFALTDTYMEVPFTLLVDRKLYVNSYDVTTKAKIGIVRNMFMVPSSTSGQKFSQDFVVYDDIAQMYSDYNADKIDGFYLPQCALCCVEQKLTRDFITLSTNATTPYKLWISNQLGSEYVTLANVLFDQRHEALDDELILQEQAKYKVEPDLVETLKANLPIVVLIIGGILLAFSVYVIFMQKKKQKEIRLLVEVDNLTGLMTKYKFIYELETLLQTARPNEYLIMALDIDNFKYFNKTYGNAKGDELLRVIGNVLDENAESFVCICRLQNDNFVALLRNKHQNWAGIDELKDYNRDFQRNVKSSLNKKLKKVGIDSQVYFSSGVYVIENPNEKIDYILDCVLMAKNVGKSTFGNTTVLFTDEIREKQNMQNEIISSMEKAIQNKEISIMIQPKVELETGRLAGGEVLVRWEKMDGTFISPNEFIPLLEKNHFIKDLDKYVFEQTCQFTSSTNEKLPILAVNISVITVLNTSFVKDYVAILKKYNLNASQFELELTESAFDADFESILKVCTKLRELGFKLAIDDFGKGASSLARLKDITVDLLKLDKDFITNNTHKKYGEAVIASIIGLANNLGIKTLVEGIETKEDLDLLIKLGCDLGQGYYFDKPLSADVFLERIIENKNQTYEKHLDTTKSIIKMTE